MPLLQEKLDDQHAVIVTALGVLSTTRDAYLAASDAYDIDPSAPNLEARDLADAELTTSREDFAKSVARVVQIHVEELDYRAVAGAGLLYDVAYQIALALGKGL